MAGKPGLLQSMGSQRVRHNLVTKQKKVSEVMAVFFLLELDI